MKRKTAVNYPYLFIVLFIILAILSSLSPFFALDLTISKAVQNIHFYPFDLLMRAVSSVGNGRIFPVAVISMTGLIAFLNLKVEALYLGVSSAVSILTGSLAKALVNRPRPGDDLVQIYKHLSDKSFPSSHTIAYTVIFGFLIFIALTRLKPSWEKNLILLLSIFLVSTVGISRIYLGAHWASDVLGGYLLGAFWLLITVNIYKAHVQR